MTFFWLVGGETLRLCFKNSNHQASDFNGSRIYRCLWSECSHQPPPELGNNSKVSVRLCISLEGELCYCLTIRSCLTLFSIPCSPLGSSVHGISQARIQEWVAISFSRGSSAPSTSELQVESLLLNHCGSPWGGTQFSSITQSCLTLCDPMNHSTPGLPVHHQLPEFTQTHVHWVGDAIQPSHPLSSPSPPAPNPSQH